MSNDTKLSGYNTRGRTEQLLEEKKELEAKLKKIESELQRSNTFSHSDGVIFSSKSEDVTRVLLERKCSVNYSINNQLDSSGSQNSCETNFETSSVFDLRGTVIRKKKETFFIYGRTPNLAKVVSPEELQNKYYLGCMTKMVIFLV